MFVYNTSFHRSIKTSPFFLTFGMEARSPSFMAPDVRRKFYGESTTDELMHRLLTARDVARRNNEDATAKNLEASQKVTEPHNFKLNQLVLLDEHSFLHKNAKLAPKWTGPHRVVRLIHDNNVELKLQNGRKLVTHTNRLKPYFVPFQKENEFIEKPLQQDAKQQDVVQKPDAQASLPHKEEIEERFFAPTFAPPPLPEPVPVQETAPPPPVRRNSSRVSVQTPLATTVNEPSISLQDATFAASAFIPPPPKRGRGRPRKSAPASISPAQEGGGVGESLTEELNVNLASKIHENDWIVVSRKRRQRQKFLKPASRSHQCFTKAQQKNLAVFGDLYNLSEADYNDAVFEELFNQQEVPNDPDDFEPESDEEEVPPLPPEPPGPAPLPVAQPYQPVLPPIDERGPDLPSDESGATDSDHDDYLDALSDPVHETEISNPRVGREHQSGVPEAGPVGTETRTPESTVPSKAPGRPRKLVRWLPEGGTDTAVPSDQPGPSRGTVLSGAPTLPRTGKSGPSSRLPSGPGAHRAGSSSNSRRKPLSPKASEALRRVVGADVVPRARPTPGTRSKVLDIDPDIVRQYIPHSRRPPKPKLP